MRQQVVDHKQNLVPHEQARPMLEGRLSAPRAALVRYVQYKNHVTGMELVSSQPYYV